MGFIIPVVYVWTLVHTGTLCFFRKSDWPHIVIAVICVYGLGLYHYFIHRSGVSSYYAVCVPLVMVICFWLKPLFSSPGRAAVLAGSILTALITSHLFTYYPNILNLAGHDWAPEKEFYQRSFDFTQDADLIRRLTGAAEPVPLISSFETKILMQAGRKPFFYYFPLIESAHMRTDLFRGTYLHTRPRLEKTLRQLESSRPSHVFVEEKIWRGPGAALYQHQHQNLKLLLGYIRQNYEELDKGGYLVALKRKNI